MTRVTCCGRAGHASTASATRAIRCLVCLYVLWAALQVVDLLAAMLEPDPALRISASDALKHPAFRHFGPPERFDYGSPLPQTPRLTPVATRVDPPHASTGPAFSHATASATALGGGSSSTSSTGPTPSSWGFARPSPSAAAAAATDAPAPERTLPPPALRLVGTSAADVSVPPPLDSSGLTRQKTLEPSISSPLPPSSVSRDGLTPREADPTAFVQRATADASGILATSAADAPSLPSFSSADSTGTPGSGLRYRGPRARGGSGTASAGGGGSGGGLLGHEQASAGVPTATVGAVTLPQPPAAAAAVPQLRPAVIIAASAAPRHGAGRRGGM